MVVVHTVRLMGRLVWGTAIAKFPQKQGPNCIGAMMVEL